MRRHIYLAFAAVAAPVVACGVAGRRSPGGPLDAGTPRGSEGADGNVVVGNGEGGGNGDGGNGDDAAIDATVGDAGPAEPDAGEAAMQVNCPATSLLAGDVTRTLVIDGGSRAYYVHVPPGLSPSTPHPLVFAFHGGGQSAVGPDASLDGGFEGFTHIHAKADSSGFVLVEPEGTPALPGTQPGTLDVWNAGNCCEAAEQKNGNIDDVGFVVAMIDSISQEICIDPKRIFATGFSNGGMLSHRLACQLSDKIAAIATVSGGMGNRDLDVMPPATLFPCTPPRPVPVLHIHGTQDACYPFDGGFVPLSAITAEPVMTTVENWAIRNGCTLGTTTVLTNGAASCRRYSCPHPGDVELCTIDGGGHYWPGGDDWAGSQFVCGLNQGARSADLLANDALWSWFADHPMP